VLGPAERLLLERLTVFAESCELDDVVAVCAFLLLDEAAVAAAIAELVDQSLVERIEVGSVGGRYGLLQTMSGASLRPAWETRTVPRSPPGTGSGQGLAMSGRDAPVAETASAVRNAVASGDRDEALRLTVEMAGTWTSTDPGEGLALLRHALHGRTLSDNL